MQSSMPGLSVIIRICRRLSEHQADAMIFPTGDCHTTQHAAGLSSVFYFFTKYPQRCGYCRPDLGKYICICINLSILEEYIYGFPALLKYIHYNFQVSPYIYCLCNFIYYNIVSLSIC